MTARDADTSVVQRMARGDGTALAELYDRHAVAVFSLALRITGNRAEAEDVTQEVFAQAWMSAPRYDAGRGAVAAWLLVITRTRSLDLLRRRRTRPFPASPETEIRAGAIPDDSPDVDILMASAEDAARVRTALSALPDDQREAVTLAYYEGLSHTEIAARTNTPLGTIKTRIRTGLQRLRDAWMSPPGKGKEAP